MILGPIPMFSVANRLRSSFRQVDSTMCRFARLMRLGVFQRGFRRPSPNPDPAQKKKGMSGRQQGHPPLRICCPVDTGTQFPRSQPSRCAPSVLMILTPFKVIVLPTVWPTITSRVFRRREKEARGVS